MCGSSSIVPKPFRKFASELGDIGKLILGSAAGGAGGATGAALATGNDPGQALALDAAGLGTGAAIGAAGPAAAAGGGGSGLTIPANAGEILGIGGGSGVPLGGGITPGVASSGIGGGALGTGIAPGALGSIGALEALKFSPAAMEAIRSGGMGVPGPASGGATAGNAAGGIRLGPNAGSALGISAPSAPGGLPAPAGGAAASPAGAATAGGVAAGAQPSFVDSIIQQLKQNALGLGLMGASMAMSAGQTPMPNEEQINALGQEGADTARQLLQQYRSGTLSQGQQAGLDQQVQNAKNQITNYFASIGQADSTAHMQALQQVDQTSLQMKQQMLDGALQQGLSAIGVAQGPLNTVAQYQLGQDQNLSRAFGNFAGAVGTMFGRQAGTPQPTQTTASATPNIMGAQ